MKRWRNCERTGRKQWGSERATERCESREREREEEEDMAPDRWGEIRRGSNRKKGAREEVCLFGWLFGFLTSSSTTGYIPDGPQDRASDNFTCCQT